MKEEIKVIFYTIPLKIKMEELESVLIDDEILHEAIIRYREDLKKENIETWITNKNMIVTEDGYKVALDEESANILEKSKAV